MPRRNLAIFPDFDGMLHKVFFLRQAACSGGQIFKQEIQGSGTLLAGLLADGGGYDTVHAAYPRVVGTSSKVTILGWRPDS